MLPRDDRSVLSPEFVQIFAGRLREKWREMPAGLESRALSSDLLGLSDWELLRRWEIHREETSTPEVRGWYQQKYKDALRGRRVLDFGCGFSVDGIFFAQAGAEVTFADIVEDNLVVLKRITAQKGVAADFYFVDDFFQFRFSNSFDVMLFLGSIHNAPFEFARREVGALLDFLRPGGMALMLAYPKERYVRSGTRNFEEFGRLTDGERTPWCEWYDEEKARALFGARMNLRWSTKFGRCGDDFVWFELERVASQGRTDLPGQSTKEGRMD